MDKTIKVEKRQKKEENCNNHEKQFSVRWVFLVLGLQMNFKVNMTLDS